MSNKNHKAFPFPTITPSDTTITFDSPSDLQVLYVFTKWDPTNGGFTIAYRYANGYKSCKMIELAVSHCSVGDTFNKKIGRALAISNFTNGRTITVPANADRDREMLHGYLKHMFAV